MNVLKQQATERKNGGQLFLISRNGLSIFIKNISKYWRKKAENFRDVSLISLSLSGHAIVSWMATPVWNTVVAIHKCNSAGVSIPLSGGRRMFSGNKLGGAKNCKLREQGIFWWQILNITGALSQYSYGNCSNLYFKSVTVNSFSFKIHQNSLGSDPTHWGSYTVHAQTPSPIKAAYFWS